MPVRHRKFHRSLISIPYGGKSAIEIAYFPHVCVQISPHSAVQAVTFIAIHCRHCQLYHCCANSLHIMNPLQPYLRQGKINGMNFVFYTAPQGGTMSLKTSFDTYIQNHSETAFAVNHYLADHPELSSQEYRSSAYIADLCRKSGIKTDTGICDLPTAFLAAAARSPHAKGKLAVLCEYDALPSGHACGHSANASMSILAALAFHDMQEDLSYDVDLVGTPDEELHGGKAYMCQKDFFRQYDAAMMVHASSDFSVCCEKFLALNDYIVTFRGVPAHAASEPWMGKNALNGAMLSIHALDMLRQHLRPETRMLSIIRNGGTASNIVPEKAEVECCVRHSERPYLNSILPKVMNCFAGAALATETEYAAEDCGLPFDSLKWNEPGVETIRSVMKELSIPFQEPDVSSMGSSDIGNVSWQCPAFHPSIALSDHFFACHTDEMIAAVKSPACHPGIISGARIIGHTFLRFMEEEALMRQIKKSFAE